MSLDLIHEATKAYNAARNTLVERVDRLRAMLDGLTRRRLPGIKSALAATQDAEAALAAAIEQHPELFQKPRTLTLEGIKIGYRKGKGKILVPNEEHTLDLIRRRMPDKADTLIITTQSLSKTALAELTASQLKAIGCAIEDVDDQVVIKPQDTAVEKLVTALLKQAPDEDA